MTSRRSFLGRVAGGLAAGSALRGIVEAATPGKPPLGLQLWSVRKEAEKDLPATLKQVRSWGFEEVEATDDFHGRTAEAFAAELKSAGLRSRAMHVGWELLQKQMPTVLKNADALGVNTIVNWSDPALGIQSTTNLLNPFTDVSGASPPYTNNASTNGVMFFRFKP